MSYQPSQRAASGTNSLAVVSLVFGILTWCLLPFVGAIVAIVCGHLSRGEIRRAPPQHRADGDGMAIAGLILGYVHLLFIIAVLLVVFGVLFLSAGPHWH
jgi:hypothetical protein